MKSALDIPALLRELDRRIDADDESVETESTAVSVRLAMAAAGDESLALDRRGCVSHRANGLTTQIPLSLADRWRVYWWVRSVLRRQCIVDQRAVTERIMKLLNLNTKRDADHAPEQATAAGY